MKRFFLLTIALLLCNAGAFAQYTNVLDGGTDQTVTNAWTTNAIWVGATTPSNTLYVIDGGAVIATNVYVGSTSNAINNTVSVTGTGTLDIQDTLEIGTGASNTVSVSGGGTITAGNLILRSGNQISLASGGSISLGSSMKIYSNSTIDGTGDILFGATNATLTFFGDATLNPGIRFIADASYDNELKVNGGTFTVDESNRPYINFQTLTLSNSTLNGHGLLDPAFETFTMIGGTIDPAGSGLGQLELTNSYSLTGTKYRAQVISNDWDKLVFRGSNTVDLADMSVEVSIPYIPTTTNDIVILSAASLTNTFSQIDVSARPLLYTAELILTNNDTAVQVVLVPVESGTISATLDFASTEMIRAGFNGMKNSVFTRTKQLRRNLVSTAHSIPNEVYLLTNTNAPAGAMGPGDQNTIFDMHVWMQQYSGQGDFDSQGSSDGFTLNNQGTAIGADRLIGDALIVGFNYTYARSSARTTGMDDLDTETYWLGAYGEWVGEQGLYVDAMAAYGRSNYDATRREDNDNYLGTASYRGQSFGAYADVGQYYYHGDLALSPYAGIHVLSILADGHSETEKEGSTVYVDEVTRDMAETAIGLKLRHRFDTLIGRFQTTGFAEWAHDFIEDDVSATLTAQGFPPVNTGSISPDADTFNVGLGYSWINTDYMEIGIGYNGRFSENYEEHTGALMLDIMF